MTIWGQLGIYNKFSMVLLRLTAWVALVLVCTTALPTYEDEVHELHETGIIALSLSLRHMRIYRCCSLARG